LKDPLDANLIVADGEDLKEIDFDAMVREKVPVVVSQFTSNHLAMRAENSVQVSYCPAYAKALERRSSSR
jgi:hypothetical protein